MVLLKMYIIEKAVMSQKLMTSLLFTKIGNTNLDKFMYVSFCI